MGPRGKRYGIFNFLEEKDRFVQYQSNGTGAFLGNKNKEDSTYVLYRPAQLPSLIQKLREKKSTIARFLVRKNKDLVFAEEGDPNYTIPAHVQMLKDKGKFDMWKEYEQMKCLAAGNVGFNDNDEIAWISPKSGGFSPPFDCLQFVLDAIFDTNVKLAKEVEICEYYGTTRKKYSSSELREHYESEKKAPLQEGSPEYLLKKLVLETITTTKNIFKRRALNKILDTIRNRALSEEDIRNIFKNVLWVSLQRRKDHWFFNPCNTTDSGIFIRETLNTKQYEKLRQVLNIRTVDRRCIISRKLKLGSSDYIHYRDLRNHITKQESNQLLHFNCHFDQTNNQYEGTLEPLVDKSEVFIERRRSYLSA